MNKNWLRKSLEKFVPYVSARSLATNAKVFLDANELAIDSLCNLQGLQLNRYPDPLASTLREELAKWLDINSNHLMVTAGSDQGIERLIQLTCEPFQDSIAIVEPTYGMYRVSAELMGVGVRSLALNSEFDLEPEKILSALEGIKILFLCSPNNPTGNLLSSNAIHEILSQFPGLVVLDQAYIEFSNEGDWAPEVVHYPNLVVLRTFSKAWGMAALRLGYVIANPEIIANLRKVMPPYPVNSVSVALGEQAVRNRKTMQEWVQSTIAERERLRQKLSKLPMVQEIFPSDTNFLLVDIDNAKDWYSRLAAEGIFVRYRDLGLNREGLRITVGTRAENDKLLEIFGRLT